MFKCSKPSCYHKQEFAERFLEVPRGFIYSSKNVNTNKRYTMQQNSSSHRKSSDVFFVILHIDMQTTSLLDNDLHSPLQDANVSGATEPRGKECQPLTVAPVKLDETKAL